MSAALEPQTPSTGLERLGFYRLVAKQADSARRIAEANVRRLEDELHHEREERRRMVAKLERLEKMAELGGGDAYVRELERQVTRLRNSLYKQRARADTWRVRCMDACKRADELRRRR